MTPEETFDRLESFRKLEPGWDSYQAEAITEDALQLASLLLGVPEISPTVAGGVLLEWRQHRPGGLYVEIEVLPDGMLEVLLMRGDETAQEWSEAALASVREAAERAFEAAAGGTGAESTSSQILAACRERDRAWVELCAFRARQKGAPK
jgi:hypothetical protein